MGRRGKGGVAKAPGAEVKPLGRETPRPSLPGSGLTAPLAGLLSCAGVSAGRSVAPEGPAPKGELSSIPQGCKFQWKLSRRGSSSFTLETGTWRRVWGGRGGAGAGPARSQPRVAGGAPPWPGPPARPPQGFAAEGAGANVGPVWLSHPLVIRSKVALGSSPASCFLPPGLLVSWSRAETCEVSGAEPASLPRGTRHPGRRRVRVLRTRNKLSGSSRDTYRASPAPRGEEEPGRGGQVRVRGTLLCEWHLKDSFSSGG